MKIVIFGAGGHSQAIMEALSYNDQYEIMGYIDNNQSLKGKVIYDVPVLGGIEVVEDFIKLGLEGVIVAIGDNKVRKEFSKYFMKLGIKLINVIHPQSTISDKARIGSGVYIGPKVVIGPNVTIGDSVIVNLSSCLPHNNVVGNYVNIAPNVSIGGGTKIGEETLVGIGSSIIQYINIGKNVTIGAGSVVINDVLDNVTMVGVPGKIIRIKDNKDEV